MRRLRVPAPLVALLAVAAVLGVTWTLVVAPFQQPDEVDHIARTQRMTTGVDFADVPDGKKWSSWEEQAVYGLDALRLFGNPAYKTPWSAGKEASLREAQAAITRAQKIDLNGHTVADDNPPLYYAYAGLFFRLGGDFYTRTWAVRAGGVLLLLGTVAGVWLLAGEVFRRDRLLQAVAAGFAALQPMTDSISSAVTPDGALITLFTLGLWLCVRVARRPPDPLGLLALAVVVVAGCLVKTPAYALIPAAGVAIACSVVRARRPDLRLTPRRLLVGALGAIALLAALYGLLRLLAALVAPQLTGTLQEVTAPRRFLSYLWQFYLGRPDWLVPTPNVGLDRFRGTWITGGWGAFGSLETTLPSATLTAIQWAGWGLVVLAVVALVRFRRRIDVPVAATLLTGAVVLMLGLHLTEFRVLSAFGGPFLQGRYILPLVGVGALVVATAVAALPRAWRPTGAGVVLAGSLAVQLVALYTVVVRFYAA